MTERIEKRIKVASVLTAGGLFIQLLSLLPLHPLAFVGFLIVGCPLMIAGVVLYLTSLVG
jgi:hypothetical protein